MCVQLCALCGSLIFASALELLCSHCPHIPAVWTQQGADARQGESRSRTLLYHLKPCWWRAPGLWDNCLRSSISLPGLWNPSLCDRLAVIRYPALRQSAMTRETTVKSVWPSTPDHYKHEGRPKWSLSFWRIPRWHAEDQLQKSAIIVRAREHTVDRAAGVLLRTAYLLLMHGPLCRVFVWVLLSVWLCFYLWMMFN